MNRVSKVVAACLLAGAANCASASSDLVLSPSTGSVLVGDSFDISVQGRDFIDILIGGGFDLDFDANLLQLDAVTINVTRWEFEPRTGTTDNISGRLSDISFATFRPGAAADFDAAVLRFTAKAVGNAFLTLLPSDDFPFANEAADVVPVNFGGGTVEITAVPVPTGVVLMLSCLGTLVACRRSVRKT